MLYNRVSPGVRARRVDREHFFDACNDYFDKIFIITLKRNLRRQDFVRKSLHGLKFEFVEGVDGQQLTEAEKLRIYSYERNKKTWPNTLSNNEIACSLSHAQLYTRIVNEEIKRCLIFEDDAYIETKRTMKALLQNLPENWDVVRLGFGIEYPLSYILEPFESVIRLLMPSYRMARVKTRRVAKYLRTAGGHSCTVAYGVTLEGARKLLTSVYPIGTLPDNFLDISSDGKLIESYHAVPRVFADATETLGSSIWENLGN
jgi:glycosyl transferase family 25